MPGLHDTPARAPLAGVRIVETGDGVALRLCGLLLADAGAHVTRLRPARPGAGEAIPYAAEWDAFLDTGKHVAPAGDADALLAGAHLLLTSHLDDAPLGCDEALARHPGLAAACVTGSGQAGPEGGLPADDVLVSALCGLADATPGIPDHAASATEAPVQSLTPFAAVGGAVTAAVAVMGALLPRLRGAPGPRRIEVAAVEAAAAMMAYEWGITANSGEVRGRRPFPLDPAPNLYLPTADGMATLVAFSKGAWASLVEIMGRPAWADDPDFAHPRSRAQHLDRLEPLLAEWLAGQPGRDWMEAAQAAGMPCGCSLELHETVTEEHVRATGAVTELGGRLVPADPIRWDGSRRPRTAPPAAPPDAPALGPAAAGAPLPLAGIRVIDFGQFVAGPWCGQLLASLGADVVIVEPPGVAASRALGPFADPERKLDSSAMFNVVNRGKRSVQLDLKSAEGHAAALQLIAGADVVVENFSRDAAEALGLTWERLSALRPSLVLASVSGFGRSGPWGSYVGLHSTVLLLSGAASVTRDPSGRMRLAGAIYPDLLAGAVAALAVEQALAVRARTGHGSQVEVAMLDVLLNAMGGLVGAAGHGERFGPHPDATFVATAEEGRWVAAAAPVLGPLRAQAAALPRAAAAGLLRAAGIPAAPVRDIGEVMHDPHLRARGFAYDADHPVAGIRPAAGVPWLYDGVRTRIGPAPLLGSATQELTGLEPPPPPARR